MDEILLPPCLRRLSNQLRVDFAANIHSTNAKRKREPTRTIYEEATHIMKKDEKQRALKSMMKRAGLKKNKMKSSTRVVTENEETHNHVRMMDAAALLAQMSAGKEGNVSHSNDEIDDMYLSKNSMEAIAKAHNDTLAAKDYVIKAITAALAAKEELVRAQATLIVTMQQCAAVLDKA